MKKVTEDYPVIKDSLEGKVSLELLEDLDSMVTKVKRAILEYQVLVHQVQKDCQESKEKKVFLDCLEKSDLLEVLDRLAFLERRETKAMTVGLA